MDPYFCLYLALAVLTLGVARRSKLKAPNGAFKLYLSSTVLLGLAIAAVSTHTFFLPEPAGYVLGNLLIAWTVISALATFGAPRSWSIIPMVYIASFMALIYGSIGGLSRYCGQMDLVSIAFGVFIPAASISGHLILYDRKRPKQLIGERTARLEQTSSA